MFSLFCDLNSKHRAVGGKNRFLVYMCAFVCVSVTNSKGSGKKQKLAVLSVTFVLIFKCLPKDSVCSETTFDTFSFNYNSFTSISSLFRSR